MTIKMETPESALIKWTLVENINTNTYISNDDSLCVILSPTWP